MGVTRHIHSRFSDLELSGSGLMGLLEWLTNPGLWHRNWLRGPGSIQSELRRGAVFIRDGGCLHSLWSGVSAADACFITLVFFTERLAFLTQATYQKLLPLYFPRSLKEESRSLPYLPADIGNAEGEPVVPERQIRISEKPGAPEGEFPFLNFPLLEAEALINISHQRRSKFSLFFRKLLVWH